VLDQGGDPRVVLEPEVEQGVREAVDAGIELGKRHPPIPVDDGRPARERPDRPVEQGGDRGRQRKIAVGHTRYLRPTASFNSIPSPGRSDTTTCPSATSPAGRVARSWRRGFRWSLAQSLVMYS